MKRTHADVNRVDPTLYVRPLSVQERQALQEGAESRVALKRRRCRILLASAQGRTSVQIGREVGCCRHTVRNAILAFHKRGLACLDAQPHASAASKGDGSKADGSKADGSKADGSKADQGPPRRRKSMPHNRAIQHDHAKRPLQAPPDEEVEKLLREVATPATLTQIAQFRAMGLRERVLTLPVFVAFVLSLLWRQMGSVADAVRALQREGLLGTGPVRVSGQAAAQRLQTFPSCLFWAVLMQVLPVLQERWQQRQRPLSPAVAVALRHFECVVALDGSTLDGLLRKVGLLRQEAMGVLAGRMGALLDVGSRLPRALWYEEDSQAHDQCFVEKALQRLATLPGKALLLMDRGFTDYGFYERLCQQQTAFITRLKNNAHAEQVRVLLKGPGVTDALIRLGEGSGACASLLRLVEVSWHGKQYRYLTNVLQPQRLPAQVVVSLYLHRWCIEEALLVAKRLLGLAYFLTGSQEGVQTQLWATWLLYAVLVDLTDEVAEHLGVPYDAVSLQMVFRGLYHYTQARQRGEKATPATYLARPDNRDLGVLKRDPPVRAYALPFELTDSAALS